MSKESEWAESVVRAYYDQPHLRKWRTERCHLTVALSIAPAVEVDEHRVVRLGAKVSRPDIQVQTVLVALDVREPWRRKLRAGRTIIVGLAGSTPFRPRLRRLPAKVTNWRCRIRNPEKRRLIRG